MTESDIRRGRLKLLLVATLFLAPVLGAYVVYFWVPGLAPQGTTNYGELQSPVRALPAQYRLQRPDGGQANDELLGKWTLVQLAPRGCEARCEQNLVLTRQVRLALNDKRTRVQRMLITRADLAPTLAERLGPEHPQLLVRSADAELQDFLQLAPDAVLLLDPHGNAVMRYVPVQTPEGVQADFKGIVKDLKKLLKLSNIG